MYQPTLREDSRVASATGQFRFLARSKIMLEETKHTAKPPKGYIGLGMEGFIANWYARQTAKDIGEFQSTAQRLAPQIKAGARVLEIAPGPGYLAIELARLTGCRMIGLDISKTFVEIASQNAEKAGVDVCFDQGDAAEHYFGRICLRQCFSRICFRQYGHC
jgi:2-polyprenyl-3-methyl-5-hydroxy-6-metoxy-1,4-benzoquinol methylase